MKWSLLTFWVLFILWHFKATVSSTKYTTNTNSYKTIAKPSNQRCGFLVKIYRPGVKISPSIRNLLSFCWRTYKIRFPRPPPPTTTTTTTTTTTATKYPLKKTTPPKQTPKRKSTPKERRTTLLPINQEQNRDGGNRSKTNLFIGVGVACGAVLFLSVLLLLMLCRRKKSCCWRAHLSSPSLAQNKEIKVITKDETTNSITQSNVYTGLDLSSGTMAERPYETLNDVHRDRLYTEVGGYPVKDVKNNGEISHNHYEVMSVDSMKNKTYPTAPPERQHCYYEIPNDSIKVIVKDGIKMATRRSTEEKTMNGIVCDDSDYIDLSK